MAQGLKRCLQGFGMDPNAPPNWSALRVGEQWTIIGAELSNEEVTLLLRWGDSTLYIRVRLVAMHWEGHPPWVWPIQPTQWF